MTSPRRDSLHETIGDNDPPDVHAMFTSSTSKSWLITNIDDTCDVLEEAVDEAFRGRRGSVHIQLLEDLAHDELPDENCYDTRLDHRPPWPTEAGARSSLGRATTWISRKARTSVRPMNSGRPPVTSTVRSVSRRPSPTGPASLGAATTASNRPALK
jgi:thiamine pyrophosphate-dependent acetolactate synthase large subunit-like protein